MRAQPLDCVWMLQSEVQYPAAGCFAQQSTAVAPPCAHGLMSCLPMPRPPACCHAALPDCQPPAHAPALRPDWHPLPERLWRCARQGRVQAGGKAEPVGSSMGAVWLAAHASAQLQAEHAPWSFRDNVPPSSHPTAPEIFNVMDFFAPDCLGAKKDFNRVRRLGRHAHASLWTSRLSFTCGCPLLLPPLPPQLSPQLRLPVPQPCASVCSATGLLALVRHARRTWPGPSCVDRSRRPPTNRLLT